MSAELREARAVADAVLYEGFLLYPYTLSALKNRMRWQFGVLMPQGYTDASEPTAMQTELLIRPASADARIEAVVRFLHVENKPVEREVPLVLLVGEAQSRQTFQFDGLHGSTTLECACSNEYARIRLTVDNETTVETSDRNEALRGALVSTHALFDAHDAEFVSLLDPPDDAREPASQCRNSRVFPVLIGRPRPDERFASMALASPIILYDYPRVAHQSAGHTFDNTEIDELLLLSVAALSEEEKREARSVDERALALVDRAEALEANTQRLLHGSVTMGSRVRVHPKRRADAFDIFAEGKTATVRGVHEDVDGRRYVSVLFDDDPASDMHDWYGRGFFYETDEIEPLRDP